MDLHGTRLVVLSACDTGVGDSDRSAGIYGLRRALVLAGAETHVVSLWNVSDAGTSHLMEAYYRKLRDGAGRSDALRQLQLEMLEDPRRRHPFYWASFIVSGDPSPLDGAPGHAPRHAGRVQPARGCACDLASPVGNEGVPASGMVLFLFAAWCIRRRRSR